MKAMHNNKSREKHHNTFAKTKQDHGKMKPPWQCTTKRHHNKPNQSKDPRPW